MIADVLDGSLESKMLPLHLLARRFPDTQHGTTALANPKEADAARGMPMGELEPQHVPIKLDRPLQVRDLDVCLEQAGDHGGVLASGVNLTGQRSRRGLRQP